MAAPTYPADLDGTWFPASFAGARDLTPADPAVDTELTLASGRATGSGGVNRFRTTFAATGQGGISFGPVASTRMAGPDSAMTQESEFFAALERARRFEITEGNLVLSDVDANTLVVLAPLR